MKCIRCDQEFHPQMSVQNGHVCPAAPDRGPCEALPHHYEKRTSDGRCKVLVGFGLQCGLPPDFGIDEGVHYPLASDEQAASDPDPG